MREFTVVAATRASDGRQHPLRDAATVMLVRDGEPAGVEVFVFRRVRSMAFAAGMVVFPGGAVDPADADPRLVWPDGPPPQVSADSAVAAVRETFEECGVLLARPAGTSAPDAGQLAALRTRLLAGELGLVDVLERTGTVLDASLLHPWAHWVTPEFEPRRYDTRFFVGRLPDGQRPEDLGGEGEQARWIAPVEALRLADAGELGLMPPTRVCLEDLAAASCVDALFATERRLRPVSPWLAVRTAADGTQETVLQVDLDGVGGGEPKP